MDIQQIRYAVEVFRAGSFTKAAAQLNITQSWLSQQISSLEKETGLKLFKRTTRSVIPTEHGELFCRQGAAVLGEYEMLRKIVRISKDDDLSTLTVVTAPRLTAIELPHAIADFYSKNTQTVINYCDLDQAELAAFADDRTRVWDAAVLRRMDCPALFDAEGVESVCLLRDPVGVLCHDSHPLKGKASVSLEELHGYNIVFGLPDSKVYKDFIRKIPENYVKEQNIPIFSNSYGMMAELVRSGLAIALGNKALAWYYSLSFVELQEDLPNEVYLFWKKASGKKILTDFTEHLQAFYAAYDS